MQYTIKVTDVLIWNGVVCQTKPSEIIFEPTTCGDIVCDINTGIIHVNVPDGCKECFYGLVKCEGDCESDMIRIEICPCTTDEECGPCAKCLTDKKVCVSTCGPTEICSKECGGCAECDSDHPCKNGRACQNCKCDCPPETPFIGPNNNCIDCDFFNGGVCPPCQVCTPQGCKPIICTSGVCDPQKDKCVECVTKNDCKDPNKCCLDGKCVCCPGFVKDINGNCVPEGCTSDKDCGNTCLYCDIPTRECKPVICPPGFTCVPGKEGCHPICDCDKPLCVDGSLCVRLNGDVCYCEKCSGDCSNGAPCSPNCFCDKTDYKCKPNPCVGPCENGTECGPGCGCNKVTKQCEPCSSRVCGKCDELLGCDCPSQGSVCSDVPDCGNDCKNGFDCGPGCGCHLGRCVKCSNFDCPTCELVSGCKCTDPKIGCVKDEETCKDEASLTIDKSNCSLVATFDIKEPCSCAVITGGVIYKNFKYEQEIMISNLSATFDVELRKGNVTNLALFSNAPLLNDLSSSLINDNELPQTGIIESRTFAHYKQKQSDGTYRYLPRVEVSRKGISFHEETSNVYSDLDFGKIFDKDEKVLYRISVEFWLISELKFASNCGYDPVQMFKLESDVVIKNNTVSLVWENNKLLAIKNLLSDDKRNPVFKWYRSANATYAGSPNRKVYVQKNSEGKYVDVLYGPAKSPDGNDAWPLFSPDGELWNGYSYRVDPDCSCKSAELNKFLVCKPQQFNYTIGPCNNSIKVDPFNVCPVNARLVAYENSEYDIPNESQTYYKLKVTFDDNTSEVIDLTHNVSNHLLVDGVNRTFTKQIVAAEIYQSYTGNLLSARECVTSLLVNPVVLPLISVVNDCLAVGEYAKILLSVTLPAGLNINKTVLVLENGNETTYNGIPPVITNILKETIYSQNDPAFPKFNFTFSNGCVKSYTIPKCGPKITANPDPNKAKSELTCQTGTGATVLTSTEGFNPGEIMFKITGQAIPVTGFVNSTGIFENLPEGSYLVTATQGNLFAQTNVQIFSLKTATITLNPLNICSGDTSKLTIVCDPGVKFRIMGPPQNGPQQLIGVGTGTGLIILEEVIINQTGVYELDVNKAGVYSVKPIPGGTENINYCSDEKTFNLTSGGDELTPVIELQHSSNVCAGSVIKFRIVDNKNAVYLLSAENGVLADNEIQANTGYVGELLVNQGAFAAKIRITGLALGYECNSLSNAVLDVNVPVVTSPIILSETTSCSSITQLRTLSVFTNGATSVLIDGVAASQSGQVWSRTNIPASKNSVVVEASNGVCSVTRTVDFTPCDCPQVDVQIKGVSVCAGTSLTFEFDNIVGLPLPIGETWKYFWEEQTALGVSVVAQGTFDNTYNILDYVRPAASGETVSIRLVIKNDSETCTAQSTFLTLQKYTAPSINAFTIIPSSANIYAGTPVTFSVPQGYAIYTWGGVATGSGHVSDAITFPISEIGNSQWLYVDVCSVAGCCTRYELNVQVLANCGTPPIITASHSSQCGDVLFNVANAVGNFTWTAVAGPGNSYLNESGTQAGPFVLPTDAFPLGQQVTILISVFDSRGCTGTRQYIYTRCAGGCDCFYYDDIYDRNSNSYNFDTYAVGNQGDGTDGLSYLIRYERSKQCGIAAKQILMTLDTVHFAFIQFSHKMLVGPSNVVTSVDVISNNLPVTLAVPTSFGSCNPQTDAQCLANWLNSVTTGTGSFSAENQTNHLLSIPGTVVCYISALNTRGFDYPTISYNTTEYIDNFINSIQPSCGRIGWSSNYTLPVLTQGVEYSASYNSISILAQASPAVKGAFLIYRDPNSIQCPGCS